MSVTFAVYIVIALHNDVGDRLVVLGHNLNSHLVRALGVVEVILARNRRHKRRGIPPIPEAKVAAKIGLRGARHGT
jgi:hypothetical protein